MIGSFLPIRPGVGVRLVGAIAFLTLVATGDLAGQPPGGSDPGSRQKRERTERDFEEGISRIVKQRLSLSDEQFNQLRAVTMRLENDRRTLRRDEGIARAALRREMLVTGAPNEPRIAELLEQFPKLERRRTDLFEAEQRELAKFLQPSQRARYFAIVDELRRGMFELQRKRTGADDSTSSRRMRRPPQPGRGYRPPGQ